MCVFCNKLKPFQNRTSWISSPPSLPRTIHPKSSARLTGLTWRPTSRSAYQSGCIQSHRQIHSDSLFHRALCDQFMMLTSRGVTLTFSSGDGGVAGSRPEAGKISIASSSLQTLILHLGVSCNGTAFLPTFPTFPLCVSRCASPRIFTISLQCHLGTRHTECG